MTTVAIGQKGSTMTEVLWGNLKAYELRRLAERDTLVIQPVASLEQHGPHLAVQVDVVLVSEVALRAAREIAERAPVVVAPTLWAGLAEHHMSLGGTITLDLATYHAMLRCLCRSFQRQGFRRICLLNGHGGNVTALSNISAELTIELGVPVTTATYWTLPETADAFAGILERQANVRHACEAETSMMLALRPDLVDHERAAELEGPMEALAGHDGVYRWRPIAWWTETGVMGVPKAASDEKGERLLAAAATALARALVNPALWAEDRIA
jgi:creatinine amidohydrolase